MKKTKKIQKLVSTRLKTGDEVMVVAGRDKGKRGAIKEVLRRTDSVKLKVEGINTVKKHVRPNPQANQQGGIVTMEAYIDSSNVMIHDTAKQKGARIGTKVLNDGKKVRCFKSGGELTEISG